MRTPYKVFTLSPDCHKDNWVAKICKHCGKTFYVRACYSRRDKCLFCSLVCRAKHGHSKETKKKIGRGNKGKIISKEARDKISKSRKDKPLSEKQYKVLRKKVWDKNIGKKRPEHSKKLKGVCRGGTIKKKCVICGKEFSTFKSQKIKTCSEQCKNISHSISISGEKSHFWKGGASFEPYCPKFNIKLKEEIRIKYDRRCVLCGTPENGRKLDVHHIFYDKNEGCNGKEMRLVPLCKSCHTRTNFHKDYWEKIILSKIINR